MPAMGVVMKLLAAVTITVRWPRAACEAMSSRALGRRIGAMAWARYCSRHASMLRPGMARQRAEVEVQEIADVERAFAVVDVELLELGLVGRAIERALPDQEMDPLPGGVAAQQRVVEIEERDAGRARSFAGSTLHAATSSPYSAAAPSSHVQR